MTDQGLPLDHFSYSQSNMFRRCPYSWWLQKGKGLAERQPDYMIEGAILHRAIQLYHERLLAVAASSDLTVVGDITRQAFYSFAHTLPPEKLADMQLVASIYADSHSIQPDTIAGVEWRMERALGDGLPAFQGVIDLVTLDDRGVTITDFKASRTVRADDQRPAQSPQLRAYAWLVMGQYPKSEVGVQLDFIRHRWRTERQVLTRADAEEAGAEMAAHCKLIVERVAAVKAGEDPSRIFQRLEGAACGGCGVNWACLRQRNFPKTWRPKTDADIENLARKTMALDALLANYKTVLRGICEEHGPLDVDGRRFAIWQSSRLVVDIEQFAAACTEAGLPLPLRALQFNTDSTKRKWFAETYGKLYGALGTSRPGSARFEQRPIPAEDQGETC